LQHVDRDRSSDLQHILVQGYKELAAFLIIEIAVNDPEVYAGYRQAVSPNLAAAGGPYLVCGREVEVLEGDWRPNRMVVVRFRFRGRSPPMVE
jgi:Domain of unknown function (DUF1330)